MAFGALNKSRIKFDKKVKQKPTTEAPRFQKFNLKDALGKLFLPENSEKSLC